MLPRDQDTYQAVLENLKNILPTNVSVCTVTIWPCPLTLVTSSQAFLNVLFANYGIASLGLLGESNAYLSCSGLMFDNSIPGYDSCQAVCRRRLAGPEALYC